MTKILIEGINEFIGVCKICGCKFSYTLADLTGDVVSCPFCSRYVIHPKQRPFESEPYVYDINSEEVDKLTLDKYANSYARPDSKTVIHNEMPIVKTANTEENKK